MKQLFLFFFIFSFAIHSSFAQCTLNNATGCQCDNGSNGCDLLPDIILANETLQASGYSGVIEYAQTGNGIENGRLRVSVSTPNIGHGPLTVRASSIFLCGTDTFFTNPGTCPDGSSPRNLCFQRVYHKNGAVMTYYDRPAGSMTYHPTHQHMHVDDWGMYTLRVRDTAIADPLQWQIIGTGAKLGFCLMDYGTCSYYAGHCVDSLGNTLLNSDFPNYALGGGNYNCDPTEQGISSGYADIYYQYLDGMYITIPPGTCNGDYYIVVQIDPHNYFLEERENNNVIAIPYTLTKQSGGAIITSSSTATTVCEGTTITLTANPATTYLWSTGDTTSSISVSQTGTYSVQLNSICGAFTSAPVIVTGIASHVINVTAASGCEGMTSITANTTGTPHWFNTDTGGTELGYGYSYAPSLAGTDTFYVESHDTLFGISGNVGPVDTAIGAGAYYSNDQHEIFTVYKPVVLKTIKVFANSTNNRTIELRNSAGIVLQSAIANIAQGTQIVPLNFNVPVGIDYQLGWTAGSSPDLWRNSSGATYPYTISNLISVTGNSANDLTRWYCYYDWQIEEQPVACASSRTPVTASIIPAPVLTMSGLDTAYPFTDAPVAITVSPTGGTLSGTGVVNNTFNPSIAGIGGPYPVTYSYTDSNSCFSSVTIEVTVLDTATGVQNIDGISRLDIFPNPNNGAFELSLKSTGAKKFDLTITNQLGQKVYEEKNVQMNNSFAKNISLGNVPKGVYHLLICSERKQNTYKLVVE